MADKYNISIRLSPAQRAVIDAAAARVGLRAGQWMRQVSLERAAEQAERGARTMTRKTLTDGSGRWFDLDATGCEIFDEETRWNGNNHISLATGSQWDHEQLIRTASGRWVLHHRSQWQGSTDTWEEVTNEAAARWLAINGLEPHDACADEFAALDLDSPGGAALVEEDPS